MKSDTIVVTGANGQIGTELVSALRAKGHRVIATDLRVSDKNDSFAERDFEVLDVLNKDALSSVFQKYKPAQVYHLAALLSAKAEQNPQLAWDVNMKGLLNILDCSVASQVGKVFYPSTIAVFGSTSPRVNTPQQTVTEPGTIYGISKLAGERWCEYYFNHKGLDVRSVRYPGLVSYKTKAGGGTTDYAVDIFFQALESKKYACYLSEDTTLPMMYMPDAIAGTIQLMEAPLENIKIRSGYNLAAFSFSPEQIATAIQKYLPDFQISYAPDFRQQIAESWPQSIDDSFARNDWGWAPQFSLEQMVKDMLENIAKNETFSNQLSV